MAAFFLGSLILCAILGLAWWFSRQKTENATRMVRVILGGGALLAGLAISLRGGVILGGPIGLYGLSLLIPNFMRRNTQSQGPSHTQNPPGSSLADARDILGVNANASEDDIRKAHRDLMKKIHPDAGGSPALARQVQEARDTLLAALDGKD